MGTITKVMFGLIILSGGGGIFMAISMIPEKLASLDEAKKKAELNSKTYMSQIDDLNAELTTKDDNLLKKTLDLDKSEKDLDASKKLEENNAQKVVDANNAKVFAEQAKTKAEGDYKSALDQLDVVGKKNALLAPYEKITFKKQPVNADTVQIYLDELEALKTKRTSKKTKPKDKPKMVKGTVKNVDPKYGYITISIGATDTKKGDIYRVTRGGKFVGTIIVYVIRGGGTHCKVDKANTTGIATNPLVGAIKAGDDVELKK